MNLNLKSRGAGIRTPTMTVQLNICITTFLGELSSRYTDIQLFGFAYILIFFARINMNANSLTGSAEPSADFGVGAP